MTTVLNTTHSFKSTDQVRKLFYQRYASTSPDPKGCLVITHGLGEHSDAYAHLSKEICTSLPLDVVSWDLYGHGKSSGQRGYVGDIDWFQKDFMQLLQTLSSQEKKPLYLLSHSLGGLITLSVEQSLKSFQDLPIKGIILSNPCTKLNFTPPKWKRFGADILATLAPRATLGNEISPAQLSSDPVYLKAYNADPLRHKRISPRLFLGMLSLIQKLKPNQAKTPPTLCLLSTQDPICDADNSLLLLKDRSEIVFFEKSRHEVLNDIEKHDAISKIKEFLHENI